MICAEDERIIPAFDAAVNQQIGVHLGAVAKGVDIGALSEPDFVSLVRSSDKQPLNPLTVTREALELPEDASVPLVQSSLRRRYRELGRLYAEHNIDARSALRASGAIIDHTEAYISGYSREIGIFASKVMVARPKAKGMMRWLGRIWVPEEDGHDRLLGFNRISLAEGDLEEFYDVHAEHMQKGMHPETREIPDSMAYLGLQEGSTGPSYANRAVLLGKFLGRIPRRIGTQEHMHTRFYRRVKKAVMEVDPDRAVVAVKRQCDEFAMPGQEGIRDFDKLAKTAGTAGLLDPETIKSVQKDFIGFLGIGDRTFSSDEAKAAQYELTDPDGAYGPKALQEAKDYMDRIREISVARARRAGRALPAIIGLTVVADKRTGELSFPLS